MAQCWVPSSGSPSPLATLPYDLLLQIFLLVKGDIPLTPRCFSYNSTLVHCLYLAGVCRYWRDVAISAPLLWRDISVSLPTQRGLLIDMIQWSRDVPLHLWLSSEYDLHQIESHIIPEFHRIEFLALDLIWLSETALRAIEDAPILRRLCIQKSCHSSMQDDVAEYSLSGPLPEVSTRCLESLSVEELPYPIVLRLLSSNLRSLSLSHCPQRVSVAALVHTLASMPSLENLRLSRFFLLPGILSQPHPPKVRMPSLVELDMSINGCGASAEFLQHTSLPSSIRVEVNEDGYDSPHADHLLTVLMSIAAGNELIGPPVTAHTLWVRSTEHVFDQEPTIRIWNDDASRAFQDDGLSSNSQRSSPPSSPACVSYIPPRPEDALGSLRSICSVAPQHVSLIRTLFIKNHKFHNPWRSQFETIGQWHDCFRHLTGLEFLYLDGVVLDGLASIEVLSAHNAVPPGLPFLRLRLLSLTRILFRPQNILQFRPTPPTTGFIDRLKKALGFRKQAGFLLEKLEISETVGLTMQDVDALRELVGEVEWDGRNATDAV